jgi:hypothetical protein
MKVALGSLPLLGAIVVLAASAPASPSLTKQFHYRVAPHASVTVTNGSGKIRISARQPGQVNITATLHSSQVQVDAAQHGNQIELATHALGGSNPDEGKVDYLLEVPADGSLRVTGEDGRIEITGVGGTSTVQGDSAGISAENIRGGRLHIQTLTGAVELSNVRDSDIDVFSVSGPVSMTRVCGNNVTVNTTSGRIEFVGDFSRRGSYYLANHNADIVVTVPAGAPVEVSARSLRGAVENETGSRGSTAPPEGPAAAATPP